MRGSAGGAPLLSLWRYEAFEEELDFWRAEIRTRLRARSRPNPRLARRANALAERIQRRIGALKRTTPACLPFAEDELKDLMAQMTMLAAEAQGEERPAAYTV
ncbi:MAG: hypothetical protein ACO1SV_25840 [Fimbriimonas sp.]